MKYILLTSQIVPTGQIDLPWKVVFNKSYAHFLFKTTIEAKVFAGVTLERDPLDIN